MKRRKKWRKKRGQLGNTNALQHGGYRDLSAEKLDQRTREAKALNQVEGELVTALGGEPSPQEILIVKQAAVKAVRVALIGQHLLIANGSAPQSLLDDYLRWGRELREDLKTLGLERRAKPVQGLQAYLQESQKGS